MKVLWLITFFTVFSAEVKLKAKSSAAQIKSCPDSWIDAAQFLSGCHWVKSKDPYRLKTVYGDILGRNMDFTIRSEDSKIFIVNNSGELRVELKDGRSIQLPPGFEVWISELNEKRLNETGQIVPVDLRQHIAFLGKLWSGSPKNLKEKLEDYLMRWGNRTEMASNYYKSLAERKIASVEAHEARLQNYKDKEAARRAANRRQLYQRAFER